MKLFVNVNNDSIAPSFINVTPKLANATTINKIGIVTGSLFSP